MTTVSSSFCFIVSTIQPPVALASPALGNGKTVVVQTKEGPKTISLIPIKQYLSFPLLPPPFLSLFISLHIMIIFLLGNRQEAPEFRMQLWW